VSGSHTLTPVDHALRASAAALRDAAIPFMLGGGLACWARGGPRIENDVDLMVARADARHALDVLVAAGMRSEEPPEDWLLKAYHDDVGVDLIFGPLGVEVTREAIESADVMPVLAMDMRVMRAEEVLVSRLLALGEQDLDFTVLLRIARALREQVDWASLRRRVDGSPYALSFLTLLEELNVIAPDGAPAQAPGAANVRVRRIGA
jgi:hypothetical protein